MFISRPLAMERRLFRACLFYTSTHHRHQTDLVTKNKCPQGFKLPYQILLLAAAIYMWMGVCVYACTRVHLCVCMADARKSFSPVEAKLVCATDHWLRFRKRPQTELTRVSVFRRQLSRLIRRHACCYMPFTT